MKREEIEKLADMARIELKDGEVETLTGRIGEVVQYVAQVNDITAEEKPKTVGAVYNVMRDDEITRKPDEYTDGELKNAPETEGRFWSVKKVLE